MSNPIVHGGGLAAAAARYGGRIEDWLDLSTGINPCPPLIPTVPIRAWHRLPDKELEAEARLAAREFYGSGPRLPLPVPGTQSVIQLLPRLVTAGRSVAVLGPTYGEYARVLALAGFEVHGVSSVEEINARHGLAVVVNPNNPDGRRHDRADLLAAAERLASAGGWLVVDEAFGDLEPGASLAGEDMPNLLVFRSFGKFFGLAGIRLGFVIASDEVADQFAGWLGPWAVSGPALSVAAQLLRGDSEPIRSVISERSEALATVLHAAGLRVAGGAGLFMLVDEADASGLHDHLCHRHILTRRFDYAPTWLRFGLSPDTTGDARLAQALSSWRNRGTV